MSRSVVMVLAEMRAPKKNFFEAKPKKKKQKKLKTERMRHPTTDPHFLFDRSSWTWYNK
jgi:hypothetical protein